MKVKVLHRVPYAGNYHKPGTILDIPDKHASVLALVGKVEIYHQPIVKAEQNGEDKYLASEAVKQLADAEGIDLATVEGTGKNGRINKSDVLEYKTRMMTAQNSRNTDGTEYRTTSMAAETAKTDLTEEQSTDEDGVATE